MASKMIRLNRKIVDYNDLFVRNGGRLELVHYTKLILDKFHRINVDERLVAHMLKITTTKGPVFGPELLIRCNITRDHDYEARVRRTIKKYRMVKDVDYAYVEVSGGRGRWEYRLTPFAFSLYLERIENVDAYARIYVATFWIANLYWYHYCHALTKANGTKVVLTERKLGDSTTMYIGSKVGKVVVDNVKVMARRSRG